MVGGETVSGGASVVGVMTGRGFVIGGAVTGGGGAVTGGGVEVLGGTIGGVLEVVVVVVSGGSGL